MSLPRHQTNAVHLNNRKQKTGKLSAGVPETTALKQDTCEKGKSLKYFLFLGPTECWDCGS